MMRTFGRAVGLDREDTEVVTNVARTTTGSRRGGHRSGRWQGRDGGVQMSSRDPARLGSGDHKR
jgi:hypothetical protein